MGGISTNSLVFEVHHAWHLVLVSTLLLLVFEWLVVGTLVLGVLVWCLARCWVLG